MSASKPEPGDVVTMRTGGAEMVVFAVADGEVCVCRPLPGGDWEHARYGASAIMVVWTPDG